MLAPAATLRPNLKTPPVRGVAKLGLSALEVALRPAGGLTGSPQGCHPDDWWREGGAVEVGAAMPADRRLSARLDTDRDVEEVREIARVVAAFHDRCDHGAEVSADGTAEALTERWRANLDELRPFAGSVLDDRALAGVEDAALEFLAGRAELFEHRITAGRIVDGHGDLLADDIFCLPDGPRILDCIEFDDRLRHLDRIDDVAFSWPWTWNGSAHRIGPRALLLAYREFSGDTAPASLVHHYIAYRAVVRAKVACLRHTQGEERAASGGHGPDRAGGATPARRGVSAGPRGRAARYRQDDPGGGHRRRPGRRRARVPATG